jgi:hypothetical protein
LHQASLDGVKPFDPEGDDAGEDKNISRIWTMLRENVIGECEEDRSSWDASAGVESGE